MPPPNVTGVLTMGHVLNNTLQDILVRRARLEGLSALWIPGLDHAGIATQTVVERELRKLKKTRHDLGREQFLERVWDWRREKGGMILEQLQGSAPRATGAGRSSPWIRRTRRAVLPGVHGPLQRGHIYRGKRMVNWCPASLTALSDEEVIMKPVNGTLYRVRYELVEPPGSSSRWRRPGRRPSRATSRSRSIPTTRAMPALVGRRVWRPLNRAADPDHRRRRGGPGVRLGRPQDHPGPRQGGL